MYIVTALIGLSISLFVFVAWSLQNKLDTASDNIFLLIVIISMFSQTFDIFAQLIMSDFLTISESAIEYSLDVYLISILFFVLSVSLYGGKSVFSDKNYYSFRSLVLFLAILFLGVILLLPISYVYDPALSIPTGLSVEFTYYTTAILSVIMLVILIINKRKLPNWKFVVDFGCILLFIGGGLLQYLTVNTLHIPFVSFVMGTCVLAIYFVVANPGNTFDYEHNCFHYDAFIDYVNEVIANQEYKAVLHFNMVFKSAEYFDFVDEVFADLTHKHVSNKRILIFKGYRDEIMITARNTNDLQIAGKAILNSINMVQKKIGIYHDYQASIVIVPKLHRVKDFNSLRSIFDAYDVRKNTYADPIEVTVIDEKTIEKFNNEAALVSYVDYAIRTNKIIVKYRTIHSDTNNDVINVEAQASIESEGEDKLSSRDYFKIVEKHNKFIQIDESTLIDVCETLSRLEKHQNKIGHIFVRVSVQALEVETFVKQFLSTLANYNVSVSKICLEITNTNAITQKDIFLANLKALKTNGVSLAIGGFGSGESNLNYFVDLPIDYVKYDRSMLDNALKYEQAASILKEITSLAQNLGFEVISVAVENEEGRKLIRDCSIDLSMGKLVSKTYLNNELIDYVMTGGTN